MEKLYSLYQPAKLFDVDYQTAWRWVRRGKVPAIKTPGNQWRVKSSDVRHLLREPGKEGIEEPRQGFAE